jgi:hypothetical protein
MRSALTLPLILAASLALPATAAAQAAGGEGGAAAASPAAAPEQPAAPAQPAAAQPAAAAPAAAAPTAAGQPAAPVAGSPGANTSVAAEKSEPVTPKEAQGSGYDLKIRNLEEKVNELKEKIFRSKARLLLLKETVLHGRISGSKAVLVHRNEMGSSFRLEQVLYSLDGAPIYQKLDQDGDLDEKEEFEIFNGAIVPGNHNLSVFMVYRGHGYGIFSYLQGYVFKIRSSFAFNAEEGKIVRLKTVGYEKGGITTDLKERPDVRFEMEILKDEPSALSAGTDEGG